MCLQKKNPWKEQGRGLLERGPNNPLGSNLPPGTTGARVHGDVCKNHPMRVRFTLTPSGPGGPLSPSSPDSPCKTEASNIRLCPNMLFSHAFGS